MNIQFEPEITKELILQRTSQEAIMEHYLGVHVGKGLIRSPLRNDNNPTCSFYKNRNGDLIFHDFSGAFYGNCFDVVKYKYNCSYYKALQIIANDFGIVTRKDLPKHERLIDYSGTSLREKEETILQAEIQPFTEMELKWWKSFGITESTLKRFNVYSCKTIFINGEINAFSSKNNYIFGYYRGIKDNVEQWRFYFPQRKHYRFISNWSKTMLQGAPQLPKNGDLLVITKSMKDVMCLYELGITAIAPNSETLFVSEEQYNLLKTRFNNIICFYDNDRPGLLAMSKIRKKFNCPCLAIPKYYGAKDISDFYKKYGRDKTIELINKGKEWLNIQQNSL